MAGFVGAGRGPWQGSKPPVGHVALAMAGLRVWGAQPTARYLFRCWRLQIPHNSVYADWERQIQCLIKVWSGSCHPPEFGERYMRPKSRPKFGRAPQTKNLGQFFLVSGRLVPCVKTQSKNWSRKLASDFRPTPRLLPSPPPDCHGLRIRTPPGALDPAMGLRLRTPEPCHPSGPEACHGLRTRTPQLPWAAPQISERCHGLRRLDLGTLRPQNSRRFTSLSPQVCRGAAERRCAQHPSHFWLQILAQDLLGLALCEHLSNN